MHTFTDSLGRRWRVRLDLGRVEQIKDATGIDLFSFIDGELSPQLRRDLVGFANALFIACEPATAVGQARRTIVTWLAACLPGRWAERRIGHSFKKGLAGDTFDNAMDALVGELIDFFPQARRRILRAVWKTTLELEDSASSSAASTILSPPPTVTPYAGDSPASSELIPVT